MTAPHAAVEDWLRDVIDALIGLGPAVRRDEPDAVHQARTATRRLRVVLKLVPSAGAQGARAELKRYGAVLGAARDFEVRAELAARLLDELGDDDETDAAHERLLQAARDEYERMHAEIVDYLDGADYAHLVELLEAVVDDEDAIDELAVQHEARKHARALRYLAEALGDTETAKAGSALQDAFGERRDYALLARALDGEADDSLVRVREAARGRA